MGDLDLICRPLDLAGQVPSDRFYGKQVLDGDSVELPREAQVDQEILELVQFLVDAVRLDQHEEILG